MQSSSPTIGAAFERERAHLVAVAYRMLGSRTEAEDAVQDAWLRYAGADHGAIRDTRAWLTTATARICLDVLRSARVSRAAYPGPWLPEPIVTTLPDPAAPDPAARAERAAEVGMAMLVVLERLTPEQRVAFVLHDAFAVPFEEIAAVLSTTAAAARKLASRARRAVAEGAPARRADLAEQRRALDAFLQAAQSGDVAALAAVLAPDVVTLGDGGGLVSAARNPVVGADRVARFYAGLYNRARGEIRALRLHPALVNGDAGVVVRGMYPDGRPVLAVLTVTVVDGLITAVYGQLNPEKLTSVASDPVASDDE
jgi:RNA polymerase sigma-70 factor (ECF subfamily)